MKNLLKRLARLRAKFFPTSAERYTDGYDFAWNILRASNGQENPLVGLDDAFYGKDAFDRGAFQAHRDFWKVRHDRND